MIFFFDYKYVIVVGTVLKFVYISNFQLNYFFITTTFYQLHMELSTSRISQLPTTDYRLLIPLSIVPSTNCKCFHSGSIRLILLLYSLLITNGTDSTCTLLVSSP
jgi:hypothetical protein